MHLYDVLRAHLDRMQALRAAVEGVDIFLAALLEADAFLSVRGSAFVLEHGLVCRRGVIVDELCHSLRHFLLDSQFDAPQLDLVCTHDSIIDLGTATSLLRVVLCWCSSVLRGRLRLLARVYICRAPDR